MRKRRHSLDHIRVPRNEFGGNRQEHQSKRFLQMHCSTFITFIEMHWNNLARTCRLKYVAILNFIKWFFWFFGILVVIVAFRKSHPNIWKPVLLIWIGTPVFNRLGVLMGKIQTNAHQKRHD